MRSAVSSNHSTTVSPSTRWARPLQVVWPAKGLSTPAPAAMIANSRAGRRNPIHLGSQRHNSANSSIAAMISVNAVSVASL
jgi:hypothetical protein